VRAAATYARNLPIKIPLKYLDQLMMVARSIQVLIQREPQDA